MVAARALRLSGSGERASERSLRLEPEYELKWEMYIHDRDGGEVLRGELLCELREGGHVGQLG